MIRLLSGSPVVWRDIHPLVDGWVGAVLKKSLTNVNSAFLESAPSTGFG
jgi:hypothetical protein